MQDKIVHAPLIQPRKLIDVGCGTGIVCRQLAQQYPNSDVVGIDISTVPPHSKTAENVVYIVGDVNKLAGIDARLRFGEVDYVYQRLLICGMTNWPGYIKQMTRLLRPGGYVEVHDYAYLWYKESSKPNEDDRLISGDWKWMEAMRRGATQLGLDLDVGKNVQQYMTDAGLTHIETVKYKVPFGTWLARERPETRRIGEHQVSNMGKVISNSILPGVTRKLGLGDDELTVLKEDCRKCLSEEEGKYWLFYVTWGKKA